MEEGREGEREGEKWWSIKGGQGCIVRRRELEEGREEDGIKR